MNTVPLGVRATAPTVGAVATTPMLTESAVVVVAPYGSVTASEKPMVCG